VILFATLFAAASLSGQPPAWIQRASVPPPIVAWRIADVLGTPIPEGIAVDRDLNALEVSVIDSRFDPPRIVKQRTVAGKHVRWLRAGVKDGLTRNEIGLGTDSAAYLLRVGPKFPLLLARTVRGQNLGPRTFSH
jgi:hypothetical protein